MNNHWRRVEAPRLGDMATSWHPRFTKWYQYWRRRGSPENAASGANIELAATCKEREREGAGLSVDIPTSYFSSFPQPTPELDAQSHEPDSIHLNIDLGEERCIKLIDYGTFSHWSAIEGLMMDMEKDGMVCKELWDLSESMRVCEGDWDARVRPGWNIQVLCQDNPMVLEAPCLEDDSDSGNEDAEWEDDQWVDDVLDHYRDEWCLPRWRGSVESQRPMSTAVREPSRTMLIAGSVSMILFIAAAIVYTT